MQGLRLETKNFQDFYLKSLLRNSNNKIFQEIYGHFLPMFGEKDEFFKKKTEFCQFLNNVNF